MMKSGYVIVYNRITNGVRSAWMLYHIIESKRSNARDLAEHQVKRCGWNEYRIIKINAEGPNGVEVVE